MKRAFSSLFEQLKSFVDSTPKTSKNEPINLKRNQLINQIQKASVERLPIHVIYNQGSFTGDLIKYDKEQQKIILKNFSKDLSVIIALQDIDKIAIVPKPIRQSQELRS